MFEEQRWRMMSEQRRHEAETGERNYQNKYRHEEESEEQEENQKKAPPKKEAWAVVAVLYW